MEVIAILLFGILIINSLLGFNLICRIDKLIEINNKNQRKLKYLHRLVANAFLLPNDEITTVIHKDGDKANNKASNLEYGKPNTKHKTEVDRKRFKYLIKQKLLNDAIIAVYNGFDELIKSGYKKVSIIAASNCNYINGKKGRVDIYKGYKWDVIRMKKE